MSFDFLSLFTGTGNGAGASPPPPPGGQDKRPAAAAASAQSTMTKEQQRLSEAQRHCADLERQRQGHQNQANRLREEAKNSALVNRSRALLLLEEAKKEEANANALTPKIRDTQSIVNQLKRAMGLVAHTKMTRGAQEAIADLQAQINIEEFEEAREVLHETAGELDEIDDLIGNPVGLSDEEARMTDAQRTSSLNQELDELINGDAMASLDALQLGETRAPPSPSVTASRTGSNNSPSTARTPMALSSSSSSVPVISRVQRQEQTPTRVAMPVSSSTPAPDSRSEIAKRLAAARNAARPAQQQGKLQ